MAKVTSVIDIGSNSARMAIFRKTSRFGFHLIYEVKSKVRISEGCYENNGILQPAPMQRALSALKEFLQIAKAHKSRKLFCVATSALRDAPNAKEFLARVKKECGLSIKVIDGKSEALYGGIACANLLYEKNGITIDIGGGSTECALIRDGKIIDTISLNVGTIRIKELFFDKAESKGRKGAGKNNDKNESKGDILGATHYIKQELSKLGAQYKDSVIFGVGGSIRALSKLIMKQTNYPFNRIHGYEYEIAEHKDFFDKIIHAPMHKLESFVPQDRLDTIRSGTLILSLFLEHLQGKRLITSGAGVREGVFLADMLRNQNLHFPPNFNPSIACLQDRFSLDEKQAKALKQSALKIFDTLLPLHKCNEELRTLLGISAYLSQIGVVLNFYQTNLHGAYILLNGLEYGFSHAQRIIIELLIQYSDRKIPRQEALLSEDLPSLEKLQYLSFIIALAQSLHKGGNMPKLRYEFDYARCELKIFTKDSLYLCAESLPKIQKPTSSLEITIIEE
ncbi:Ppx/GppA family phosphatase [Helicobacter himalayensis]|uniref:Ppx/GppA phosphatase family protein n=1 Tax=Helicobacter himalayensis TaxID=1591088 RepID=UPI003D6DEBDC